MTIFLTNAIQNVRRVIEREQAAGRAIPSTDALVRECGISRATVDRSLRQLRKDGVLSKKRRSTGTGAAYSDDQEWEAKLRLASTLLLAALRREHPQMVPA